MHLYNFKWYSFEEDNHNLLIHDKKKTEEEFAEDCRKAMRDSFDKYMEQEKVWANIKDWTNFACKELEKQGYQRIDPTTFSYFGGSIVSDDIIDVDALMAAQAEIGCKWIKDYPEQIKRMIRHNKKIEDKD
ncbi:MAG: hypothetical protein ACOCP8_07300 [archaeon]